MFYYFEKQITHATFLHMSKEYSGCVKDLIDQIDKLKRDFESEKERHLNELCMLKKNNETDILKKDNENNMLKKDIELLNRDLEIEKLKNQLMGAQQSK